MLAANVSVEARIRCSVVEAAFCDVLALRLEGPLLYGVGVSGIEARL